MSHIRTIFSGIVGVAFMTLFSAIVSAFSKYEFTEHRVLTRLLHRLKINDRFSYILGWKGHILAGIGFSYLNKILVEKKVIEPNARFVPLVGLTEGFIGILIWKTAFLLHPDPPKINLTKFFAQLVFAHVVYALVSILGMKKGRPVGDSI